MKRVILSIFIALAGTMAVSAQYYYIGGSLGFNGNFSKIDNVDTNTHPSYSLSIAPEIGYSINKKTAIGLSLSATISSSKASNIGSDIDGNLRVGGLYESTGKNLEIAPYIRYSVFKWNKFDLLGMASVYVNTGKTESNSVYDYQYESEYVSSNYHSESISGTKTFTFGANIHPVLLYNFSKKIVLLAHLNFLRLDIWQQNQKNIYNSDGDEYAKTTTGFNLGLDTNNVLPSIGFIYKF